MTSAKSQRPPLVADPELQGTLRDADRMRRRRDWAEAARAAGHTNPEIAAALRLSKATVYGWRLPPRPPARDASTLNRSGIRYGHLRDHVRDMPVKAYDALLTAAARGDGTINGALAAFWVQQHQGEEG